MPNYVSLVAASGQKMAIGDAALAAVLGYAVVFVGIFLLLIVISILGKIMTRKSKPAEVPAAPAAPAAPKETAPGSAGGVKLYNVSEREAAMLMAIVADKTGKPLNELRFKSIKEVK